jgi:hypothetical protein
MDAISKTTRNNLLIVMASLLIAEGLMCDTVFFNGRPISNLLVPISLLTVFPINILRTAWETSSYEWYGYFLALIFFDIVFIWTMAFSIKKNHKTIGCLCLFVFVTLSIACYAAGS